MDRLRRSDSYLWICWCWRQDNVEWGTLSLPGGFFFLSPSRMRSHNTDWICSWNVITVKNDRTVAHVKKLCWRHWTRFGLFVLIQIHTTPYTNCWGGTLRKNQEKKKKPYLTHLKLKKPPLLLHLLCDFSAGDLSANHPVLLGVFSLLLLYLCTDTRDRGGKKKKHYINKILFSFISLCQIKCSNLRGETDKSLCTVFFFVFFAPLSCSLPLERWCKHAAWQQRSLIIHLQLGLVVFPCFVKGLLYVL